MSLIVTPKSDRPTLGILLMCSAYLMFALLDSSAKWLALAGLSALQVAFIRYLGHFMISLALIGRGGLTLTRFRTGRPVLVVVRGVLLMLTTVLNFMALQYLPLTLTATIMFSAPIIVCALSGVWLKEQVGIWRWSAILIGFIGILMAVRPFGVEFHPAALLSLANVTLFAFYTILTRKLAGEVPTQTLQFYAGLVGTIVLLPLGIGSWHMPANALGWWVLWVTPLLGWVGHECITRAHGFAEASMLTPFSYSFIVWMTASSYWVFHQPPDLWTLLGAAVVIVAGLVIWFRERRRLQR